MSDTTDDTDELLIIPPDLFDLPADLEDPYFYVVDTLISQVDHLERKLNTSIEMLGSSPTILNRKFSSSSDDLRHPATTANTPLKPNRHRFLPISLPNSPDVGAGSRKTGAGTRSKPPMIGEIDSFLTNVKQIRRLSAARNLERDFELNHQATSSLHVNPDSENNLDLDHVDQLIHQIDEQHTRMEERLRRKERELFKITDSYKTGDNISSMPDLGFGMRKTMYDNNFDEDKDFSNSGNKDSDNCSSNSTQKTAFEKFMMGDKNRGRDLESQQLGEQSGKPHEQESGRTNDDGTDFGYDLGLVSLSTLWKKDENQPPPVKEPTKFQQRLQEERMRRKAILELQNRILELQERVAVAIQVDEAKDKAILRFHESWGKIGTRLETVETEKERLEEEIKSLKNKIAREYEQHHQKLSHYEIELSKARNVSHSSQEKLYELEKRCEELQSELRIAILNSEEFQQKYLCEVDKNRHYPEIIAQKELELNECKNVLNDARKEVTQSKKAVEICQNQLTSMKHENDNMQRRIDENKVRLAQLEKENGKLEQDIIIHQEVQRNLHEDLRKAREQLESNKTDLKNFYQGQVELVVQNKLKEFQGQLDDAEKNMKDQLEKRELHIAKMAAGHIQQISDKHSLEIKLLEEKQQEQCRLYQVQLTQTQHELDETQAKLKKQRERHSHIEKQLVRFMESLRQDHVTTLDEMNSFRTRSFCNLEEILSLNGGEQQDPNMGLNVKGYEEAGDRPGGLTYRVAGETPVSSRNSNAGAARRKENIQETIQMLLDKNKGQGDVRGGGEEPNHRHTRRK